MKNIFWTGYCSGERHSTINIITNIVGKYGDIVDFKLFSDISLSMMIEIEALKIDKLYSELADKIMMDEFEYMNTLSTKERTVYLNITFIRGSGDLIIEVPSVPG